MSLMRLLGCRLELRRALGVLLITSLVWVDGGPSVLPSAVAQSTGLGPYQPNQELTNRYQEKLLDLGYALERWNNTHNSPKDGGRFVDITDTTGVLTTWWQWSIASTFGRRPDRKLQSELGGRILASQPRAAVISLDSQNWVALAFLYTATSYKLGGEGVVLKGVVLNKPGRVQDNFDNIISTQLAPLLAQSPRGEELAGVILHYSYLTHLFTESFHRTGLPYPNDLKEILDYFTEEAQFRFPYPYIDAYLKQHHNEQSVSVPEALRSVPEPASASSAPAASSTSETRTTQNEATSPAKNPTGHRSTPTTKPTASTASHTSGPAAKSPPGPGYSTRLREGNQGSFGAEGVGCFDNWKHTRFQVQYHP